MYVKNTDATLVYVENTDATMATNEQKENIQELFFDLTFTVPRESFTAVTMHSEEVLISVFNPTFTTSLLDRTAAQQ